MIRLINRKTKQVESLKDDEALNNLRLNGDDWLPIKGEDYIIKTDEGQFQIVDGENLYQTLGDTGGDIVSRDRYAVESAVHAEYSKAGQFAKSLLSESVFLGLNKSQALPQDPLSRST